MMVPTHSILYFCIIIAVAKFFVCASSSIDRIAATQTFTFSSEFIHIKAIGDKPTLLFLHGFPSSFHSWRHQTKYFSDQGYGCLVPNLMGYGKTSSPANETEYDSKSIVDHLIALLYHVNLGNSKVFVIGHDWGARTASRFVLYHPERTLGAVLLSVAYSPPGQFNLNVVLNQSLLVYNYTSIGYWEFFQANDAARIIEEKLDSFIDLIFANDSMLARTDFAPVGKVRAWLSSGRRTDRASYMTQEDYQTVYDYLNKQMQPKLNWFKAIIANVDWEYEKTLNATVQRPVLFIEGTRDYIGIIGASERQKQYISDLKIVKLDTGHWVMEEKPEEVNREIDQWIKEVISNKFNSTKWNSSIPGGDSELRGDGAIRRKHPLGSTIEQTYAGVLSFLRRNYTRDLSNVDVAVTGIPLDLATTYRPGARFGPKGIREASAQVAKRKSYPEGIDVFADLAVVDYGDCWLDFGQPHTIPLAIEAHAREIIDQNVFLLSLGGDHYSTYPLLKAHVSRHGKPLSLIQFDAHCDTWPSDTPHSLNHGSMFYYAVREGLIDPQTSIQIGIRTFNDDFMGVKILDAEWVHQHSIDDVVDEIKNRVGNNATYLTFDIDCLDPSCAPGTGTPVCGGLTMAQSIAILRRLRSINYVGMDIVEVSPAYDHSNITSLAAATIGFRLLCLLRDKKMIDKSFPFGNYEDKK
ncbi:unnamed protein product [Adineta steineri]|uniref:AB hydrolase-1 domain-containing protein n=1 Tax=Adineta steineri TaxID=433720 RepID=A0A814G109_9BILA|nr:unnamed protein product [Adineta steineri]CAF1482029.1 unnamed protein product [Adineta steineri]